MGIFERYLSLWVALSIVLGVTLGLWQPDVFQVIANLEIAHVNIVVALFTWIMIYPMMVQIDFSAIKDVSTHHYHKLVN
jgi:ACR3 family arsenite transporter